MSIVRYLHRPNLIFGSHSSLRAAHVAVRVDHAEQISRQILEPPPRRPTSPRTLLYDNRHLNPICTVYNTSTLQLQWLVSNTLKTHTFRCSLNAILRQPTARIRLSLSPYWGRTRQGLPEMGFTCPVAAGLKPRALLISTQSSETLPGRSLLARPHPATSKTAQLQREVGGRRDRTAPLN